MTVFHPLQDRLRAGGKKYHSPVFLHFHYILLSQGNAAAAGDHYIGPLLHFNKEAGLQIPEVFFTPGLKNIGNTHAFSLGDHLIHFNDLHIKERMKVFGNGGFSGSHKTDQDDIIGKQLSGLYLFTAFQDRLKDIFHFLLMSVSFQFFLQPDTLPLFLLRLEHRHIIFFFIGHQLFHYGITPEQSFQDFFIAGHKFFSVFF